MADVMTQHALSVPPSTLANQAFDIMAQHAVSTLVVIGQNHIPLGVIHSHDIIRAGVR